MDDERKQHLSKLRRSWSNYESRFDLEDVPDATWVDELDRHLEEQAEHRIEHVRAWIGANTARFTADVTNFADLYREFENQTVSLKTNSKLCKMECSSCQLVCLLPRHHEGNHDCETSHQCLRFCSFANEHLQDEMKDCGMP